MSSMTLQMWLDAGTFGYTLGQQGSTVVGNFYDWLLIAVGLRFC
jgi:hypothetical protein